MMSCANTAEPIEMPFWIRLMGPGNHVLNGGADPQGKGAIFGDFPGRSKALAIFAAEVAVAFTAKGIIQSPITPC